MSKLKNLKNAAKLRDLTHLGAVLPNETRWSGKYEMLRRFFRIEENIKYIEELDPFKPSAAERRTLEKALEHLEKFQSITINLQRKGLTIDKTRFIFDRLCEDYPEIKEYLSKNASIVNNKNFESAIVKLLSENERSLSPVEKGAIKSLLIINSSEVEVVESDDNLSYFEQLDQKRRKLNQSSKYIDCSFLVSTSCSAERLFSMAKWVLTNLRHRMSPILFEAILFLKFNRRLWDIKTVSEAMKQGPKPQHDLLDNDFFYETFESAKK